MRQHMMKISIVDNSTSRERAVALHQAGEIQEAAHMYESLLQAEPANPDILGLLSVAQLGLGKAKEALVNWRKSLSLEKTIPGKLRSIANFLLAMQKLDDVRAAFLRGQHALRVREARFDPAGDGRAIADRVGGLPELVHAGAVGRAIILRRAIVEARDDG